MINLDNIMVIIFVIISYIYCFKIAPHKLLPEPLKKLHQTCFSGCICNLCKKIANKRGNNYIIEKITDRKKKEIKNCAITFWNISHVIFYFILTVIKPKYYKELFISGILFEIFEKYKYNCHDYIDILANGIGIGFSKLLLFYIK